VKIEYLGHSAFRLTFANGKTLITDPYTRVGYELPKSLTADIVTVSHGHFDHNYTAAIQGKFALVDQPQEYAFDGITVRGVSCKHDNQGGTLRGENIAFVIQADGITVCHLGDIGEDVRQECIQKLGKIDVLLLPIGGTYTIDYLGAKSYIDAIQPKIGIPMHYRPKDGAIDVSTEKPFLDLYTNVTYANPKYSAEITRDKFSQTGTDILFMERK
jgi:L-ascorbate metabolism protein UlaG (beta-lactamase superfamily)